MANGDIFRCTIIGQQNQTQTSNTWHYIDRSGGTTEIDTHEFAVNFFATATGWLKNCLNITWSANTCRVACVAGPHAGDVGYASPTPIAGVLTGQQLPPELCISIKRATGKAARTQRGRLFLGPIDDTLLDDEEIGLVLVGNTHLVALAAFCAAGFTIDTVGLIPVLVSKTLVATATPIINVSVAAGTVHRKSRRTKGLAI